MFLVVVVVVAPRRYLRMSGVLIFILLVGLGWFGVGVVGV